jgi:GT2 family glycosyltransferase/Tfp pilus assembly protein PilF/HPt (histidine-containing phosphotransfer) domain-containing protein
MSNTNRFPGLLGSLSLEIRSTKAGSDQGQFPILDLLGNIRDEAALRLELAPLHKTCSDAWEKVVRIIESGKSFSQPDIDWLNVLLAELSQGMTVSEPQPAPPAAVAAPAATPAAPAAEDQPIVLNLASDGDLLREFITESREHLDNIEQGVLVLENQPNDAETLNTIFRAFHTFKGGAGFLNLIPINRLAHGLESLLDLARQNKIEINAPVIEIILQGRDLLKKFIYEIEAQVTGNKPATPIQISTAAVKATVARMLEQAAEGFTPTVVRPEEAAGAGPAREAAGDAPATEAVTRTSVLGATVKVDTGKLDSLLDLVGEMVIAQSLVSQNPENTNEARARFTRDMAQLGRITRELQRVSMSLRMMPIRSVFQKMARVARDISIKQHKKVNFQTSGEDTELDRGVVEELGDPLLHMIRNSMDHGLEPADKREAAGKPPIGTLHLRAYHQGGTIVVLALNQLEHTQKCVASLLAHTRAPFEVILVDNGSTDGTAEYFAGLRQQHPNFKVITNRGNRGFAAGNNQGLAVAAGELFVLLNNDTIVTPGWVEHLAAPLSIPGVGLTGPVSNRVSGPQLVPTSYASDEAMQQFAAAWTQAHAGETQPSNRLVGFCLLFNRAVLDAIGGLDESFGSGNFEDDDYCIRARLAGFSSRIARAAFIHHTGSQTFKGARIDYRAAMMRNWDIFRAKWAFPASVTLETGYPFPARKPDHVALQIALPSLASSHTTDGANHWAEAAPAAAKPKPIAAAPVAALGNLKEGLARFDRHDLAGAWNSITAALKLRPFNPDAYLLLAEIAQEAGDSVSARQCAQRARDLAPAWKSPRQFLQGKPKGNARPEWLKLPPEPGNRLTVCIITKNEEKFLAQCLKSVRAAASQIVVVDTGSTDRTVEIAKELGAEVHHFAWCDDFSAARNAALEHATGDWILILDADEELPADQLARLRADLKTADAMALRIPLVDAGQEAQGQCFVPRLFRNAPGIYYFSRIHEQVFPSLLPLCKAWNLDTKFGTARLLHHGYVKELVKERNKGERNLNLLRLAIAEQPDDANLLMNLGLEITRAGDVQTGLGHYREAFRLMSAQPLEEVVPELREVLLTQFTCHLYKICAHEEVIQALNSPLAGRGGLTASLHFALGLSLFETGRNAEAAEQMRQCLAKRRQPALAPINTDILTAAPHHCLALALAKAGDAAGAEKAFQAGLAETGRTGDLKLDYAKFLGAQNRPVEALQQLNEVVQTDALNAKAWILGGETALSRPDFREFALDWTGEAIRLLPEDRAIVGCAPRR